MPRFQIPASFQQTHGFQPLEKDYDNIIHLIEGNYVDQQAKETIIAALEDRHPWAKLFRFFGVETSSDPQFYNKMYAAYCDAYQRMPNYSFPANTENTNSIIQVAFNNIQGRVTDWLSQHSAAQQAAPGVPSQMLHQYHHQQQQHVDNGRPSARRKLDFDNVSTTPQLVR